MLSFKKIIGLFTLGCMLTMSSNPVQATPGLVVSSMMAIEGLTAAGCMIFGTPYGVLSLAKQYNLGTASTVGCIVAGEVVTALVALKLIGKTQELPIYR